MDIICAYIKSTGVEELKDFFIGLNQRDPPVQIRIFTTSQLNLSEPEAIYQLAILPNAQVKVFTASRPSFHAKGWLFAHVGDVQDVAIIGSSNMSRSAIETGVEWNVCTTNRNLVAGFKEAFDSYWSGKHPCFDKGNTFTCGTTPKKWQQLRGLFSPKIEPLCTDTTGSCGHSECQQLIQEVVGLDTRKLQIQEKFRDAGRNPSQTNTPAPPKSIWILPSHVSAQETANRGYEWQGHSSAPDSDPLQRASIPYENGDQSMHLEDLPRSVYMAIVKGDQQLLDYLAQANSVQMLDAIVNDFVPDFIVNQAKESRESTPLKLFDLRIPLLFTIAHCDEPYIVKIFYERNSNQGPFGVQGVLNSRTESVFHILARLNPLKAYKILKEIEQSPKFRKDLDACVSRDRAVSIARTTSQATSPANEIFVNELEKYFPATKRKSAFTLPGQGEEEEEDCKKRPKTGQSTWGGLPWNFNINHGGGKFTGGRGKGRKKL